MSTRKPRLPCLFHNVTQKKRHPMNRPDSALNEILKVSLYNLSFYGLALNSLWVSPFHRINPFNIFFYKTPTTKPVIYINSLEIKAWIKVLSSHWTIPLFPETNYLLLAVLSNAYLLFQPINKSYNLSSHWTAPPVNHFRRLLF